MRLEGRGIEIERGQASVEQGAQGVQKIGDRALARFEAGLRGASHAVETPEFELGGEGRLSELSISGEGGSQLTARAPRSPLLAGRRGGESGLRFEAIRPAAMAKTIMMSKR